MQAPRCKPGGFHVQKVGLIYWRDWEPLLGTVASDFGSSAHTRCEMPAGWPTDRCTENDL